MGNAALGAAKDADEFPVGAVVQDVIAAVTIEHVELAVGQVEGPRRAILIGFLVVAGVLRPTPFVEHGAIERGFDDEIS